MPTVPYVKQTWTDGASALSAARMGVLENGVFEVSYAPAVAVSHNANQSCTSGVSTVLACNTETFDQAANASDTMHDTVTNNSRLTCRYAGVYYVWADNLGWSGNPASAIIEFLLNATTSFGLQNIVGDWRVMGAVSCRKLAVNDFVELRVRQSSGGALNLQNGFNFGMVRIA